MLLPCLGLGLSPNLGRECFVVAGAPHPGAACPEDAMSNRDQEFLEWELAMKTMAALERENAALRAERDKWLRAFNESEQFQSGPTKRAEAAESRLAALEEALTALDVTFMEV